MVQSTANKILQETLDKNISDKVVINVIHEDQNLGQVEIDADMYELEQLNLEEEKDNENHKE